MSDLALPCIACGKQLRNFSEPPENQPLQGTEFVGGGCYGSRITDHGGARYAVNVCDDCLDIALRDKRASTNQPK